MNIQAFQEALEKYESIVPPINPREIRQALCDAAAPEHAGKTVTQHHTDWVECSCGWKSHAYWDLVGAAWTEWRQHVSDEMGLTPKECPCGKWYIPAKGETACHELRSMKGNAMSGRIPDNVSSMTLKDAKTLLGNRVYEAAILYERLEGKQKVRGNGHHMAQKVAEIAQNLLEERWIGDS